MITVSLRHQTKQKHQHHDKRKQHYYDIRTNRRSY